MPNRARISTGCVASLAMNQEGVDLLRALHGANVRFLVVGAYALALHGRPRATGGTNLRIAPVGADE